MKPKKQKPEILFKVKKIIIQTLPLILMIILIMIIQNDFLLLGIYIIIIIFSFLIKYHKREYIYFLFGLIGMFISEMIFIRTGVETFNRASFFGMPIWLPLLWAYAFVIIKRAIIIIRGY